MPRPYVEVTGMSPDARVCPRCGRRVGGFFAVGRWQQARHKNASGRPCRPPPLAPQRDAEAVR